MWACAVAKAVASSLLDLLDSHSGDGKTPTTHEVVSDRHAGLSELSQWSFVRLSWMNDVRDCGFQQCLKKKNGLTRVVSTTNWTPPNSGKPSALPSCTFGTKRSKSRTSNWWQLVHQLRGKSVRPHSPLQTLASPTLQLDCTLRDGGQRS